jgi:hypothetical protein
VRIFALYNGQIIQKERDIDDLKNTKEYSLKEQTKLLQVELINWMKLRTDPGD